MLVENRNKCTTPAAAAAHSRHYTSGVSQSVLTDAWQLIETIHQKLHFCSKSAPRYVFVQIINKDFLQLTLDDIKFPFARNHKIDVVFLSPPWGGVGYNLLQEYSLRYLYPDYKEVIKKAL